MSETPRRRLLILTAVRLEALAVARGLNLQAQGERTWRSRPKASEPWDATVQVVGIGAVGCLPEEFGAYHGIILAGLAGALDPALQVGELVVDEHSRPLPPQGTARVGPIHTSVRVAETPAEKAELFAATGALAVDMENARVRVEIDRLGLPFLHLRAISDTAAEAVDPAVLGLIDAYGTAKPAALAAALVRRPQLLPVLTRLGRNSKVAAARLAAAVRQVCDAGWPQA